MSGSKNTEIIKLDRAEITIEPWSWPFAVDRRDEIGAYFARLKSERSEVWNGRILMLNRYAVRDRVLRGTCFETDYANLCAWREWNFPDPDVANVYAAAALRSRDGAYLLGEMARYTAGAGQLYFPCGTPEPDDVDAHGALDLAGNLGRELNEETGLDIGELDAEPGWTVVIDGGFVALMKRITVRQDAEVLRRRILRHLAAEERPELAGIRIVRGPADFDPGMPRAVTAFLDREWRP